MDSSTRNISATENRPAFVPEKMTWISKTCWIISILLIIALCGILIYRNLAHNSEPIGGYNSNLPEELAGSLQEGTRLFELGQLEEAETLFIRLIRNYPSYPHGYNNLAALHALTGNLDQARTLLEQAMATDKGYSAIYNNLGTIYAELARESYGKALQLEPVHSRTQLQILDPQGIAQLQASDTAPAVTSSTDVETPPLVQADPAPTPQTDRAKTSATEASTAIDAGTAEEAATVTDSEPRVQAAAPQPETPTDFLLRWAAAWSAQDADAYLAFYDNDYRHPNYKTRSAWIKKRRSRIIRPAFIEISLDKVHIISESDQQAEVEVVQAYRNERFQDRTRKRFKLLRDDRSWRIIGERVLGSLR